MTNGGIFAYTLINLPECVQFDRRQNILINVNSFNILFSTNCMFFWIKMQPLNDNILLGVLLLHFIVVSSKAESVSFQWPCTSVRYSPPEKRVGPVSSLNTLTHACTFQKARTRDRSAKTTMTTNTRARIHTHTHTYLKDTLTLQ